jgi:hypothetical protein
VVIFEGKRNQLVWYQTPGLQKGWVITVSENGWTDNELGLKWLQEVFQPYTAPRTKGVYRLLILDGHGSHVTPAFDLYCNKHSIITLCMPAHSSYLL